jgi:hypothetical protein
MGVEWFGYGFGLAVVGAHKTLISYTNMLS